MIFSCFLAFHSTFGQDRTDSLDVFFQQGKSLLVPSFRNNGNALDSLFALMRQRLADPAYRLQRVNVTGFTSPEGPLSYNEWLAKKRTAVLADYMRQHAGVPDSLFSYSLRVSDWNTVMRMVTEDTAFPYRQEFLSALDGVLQDKVGNDTDTLLLYNKLRNVKGGVPYWYMYHNIYPALRKSSLNLAYRHMPVLPEVEEKKSTDTVIVAEPTQPVDTVEPQPQLREPLMAIRTNLLYDLATAVNVGIEFYTRNPHWSILAHYTFPWWSSKKNHLCLQVLDGSIEPRYYFNGQAGHTGHYLSLYGHANLYDLGLDEELGWQGEGWGAGLGYGHVWQPFKNKKWKLEAFIRVGYYHSVYDPYHAGEPGNDKYYYDWEGPIENFVRRNHRLRWFGPTGLGVTLSYDLINRKVSKERK